MSNSRYFREKNVTLSANKRYMDMCKFSEANKDKLGNALIYMAERVPDLSKTKALKLLYLMEERMVLIYHVPFLGIPYEVWQAGPVAHISFPSSHSMMTSFLSAR